MDRALTMDTRHVVDAQNSGLKGIVTSRTLSGVPGGQVTETPASVEFAVAPIEGRAPVYQKAVFVRSDAYGRYEIALAPGNYWIGPKAKALAPASYRPAALVFPETTVVVKEGRFTQLDLVETGFAP